MKWIKRVAIVLTAYGCVGNASAATWNTFAPVGTSNALFFFDADTVQRQGDTISIWVKYVNLTKPDTDGSWATATKYDFMCTKRKTQLISQSIYAKDGGFIRSYPKAPQAAEVVPDTVMEQMYNIVCMKDFPKSKLRDNYFPVRDNDIFAHAKRFQEYVESQKDEAPQ
jgi:hypothetical protein